MPDVQTGIDRGAPAGHKAWPRAGVRMSCGMPVHGQRHGTRRVFVRETGIRGWLQGPVCLPEGLAGNVGHARPVRLRQENEADREGSVRHAARGMEETRKCME